MSGIKRYDEGGYGLSNMEEAADGSWVDYDSHLMVVMGQEQLLNDKISELQQKLDEVLGEGIELRKFIRDSCYAYNGDGSDISDAYTPAEESPLFPKSAATDAILNAVRAEGADKVADYHFIRIDALKEVSRQGHLFHKAAYSDAINVANLLRADAAKGGSDG